MGVSTNRNLDRRIYDAVRRMTDDKYFRSYMKKFNVVFYRSATVTAYNSTTKATTLYFAGDDSSNTTVIPNKSGESLAGGDEVYVGCIGSVLNAYVALKK